MPPLRLCTVLLNNDTRTPNNLTGVALPVDLAKSGPGSKNLRISDLDEGDGVSSAEGFDELDVFGLSAGLDEDAKVGLTTIEGLGAFAETTGEAVVNERSLQDLLFGWNYSNF